MILNYSECLKKYGNNYQINKVMKEESIFKIEEGIYSDSEYTSEVAVLSKKYPHAVFAGVYAFYVHGLTDYVPERYTMATKSKAAPINDERVEQIYIRDDLLMAGATVMEVEDTEVLIYDRERMLVELLRNKSKWPYDFYKEVLGQYRKIIDSLEIWRIQEYTDRFPKGKMIQRLFETEVM